MNDGWVPFLIGVLAGFMAAGVLICTDVQGEPAIVKRARVQATATAAASALATAEATAAPKGVGMGTDVPGGHYSEFVIRGGERMNAASEGWREGFGPKHPAQVGGATTALTFNAAWPSTECRTEKRPHKWDGPTVKAGALTFVRCRYCDLWAQKLRLTDLAAPGANTDFRP